MFQIRYYSETFHPNQFHGFSGRTIQLFNWFRWKLEVFVQFLVLKYLLKQGNVEKPKADTILAMFSNDVLQEKLDKEKTRPDLVQISDFDFPTNLPVRGDRYRESRDKSKGEDRPKSLNMLISRYGAQDRTTRYAKGRSRFFNPDGDFEPIKLVDD